MTVSSIVPVNNYTGNGSNTKFDFDFLIENESELVVTLINEDKTETTLQAGVDYSINETGNVNGSYIIFPILGSSYSVLTTEQTISISLNLSIKQESEFKNSSHLNLHLLEWTFDYIIRILQILSRKVERSIKTQEGSNINTDKLVKNVNVIAPYADEINTVANNSSIINSVANAIESVNLVAADLSNIDSACENASKAFIWAEGTDEQVQLIGGIHSAKKWAEQTGGIDPDLTRISNAGLDIVNQTKALETGNVSYNQNIYADILSYAHSSFDSTKFTSQGSISVSSDGIASGFSSSDYLIINGFEYTNKFIIKGQFTTGSSFNDDLTIVSGMDSDGVLNNIFELKISSGKTSLSVSSDGISFDIADSSQGTYQYSVNSSYYWRLQFSGSSYKFSISTDNITFVDDIVINSSSKMVQSPKILFGIQKSSSSYIKPWNGTVNLRMISIVADDIPAFYGNKTSSDSYTINSQTVTIPYVLSKTGSKVVDVYYRTSVQALYNKDGIASYYTIDEINKNFTLPIGEIYGMIEKSYSLCNAITESLNDKADLDLDNIDSSGILNVASWTMPDFAHGVSHTWGTSFTTTQDGYLYVYATANGGANKVLADGEEIFQNYSNEYIDGASDLIPIPKNTVITYSGTPSHGNSVIFYPCKGEN